MPRSTTSGSSACQTHNRWPNAHLINGCQMIRVIRLETFSLPTGYDKLLTTSQGKSPATGWPVGGTVARLLAVAGHSGPCPGHTCVFANNCLTPTYVRDNVTSNVQGYGESAHSHNGQKYMLGSDSLMYVLTLCFSSVYDWGVLIK